jgi:hypothetical protein
LLLGTKSIFLWIRSCCFWVSVWVSVSAIIKKLRFDLGLKWKCKVECVKRNNK